MLSIMYRVLPARGPASMKVIRGWCSGESKPDYLDEK